MTKIRATSGAGKAFYHNHLSCNDYYSEHEKVSGYWRGKLVWDLGMVGLEVDAETFRLTGSSNSSKSSGEKYPTMSMPSPADRLKSKKKLASTEKITESRLPEPEKVNTEKPKTEDISHEKEHPKSIRKPRFTRKPPTPAKKKPPRGMDL